MSKLNYATNLTWIQRINYTVIRYNIFRSRWTQLLLAVTVTIISIGIG